MANLDTSMSRFTEKHQFEFVDICFCPEGVGCLRYNVADKKYFEEGGCNREFPCAILQIHKHKMDLLYRKKRLLQPFEEKRRKEHRILKTPYDQTLDQFFGG